MVTPEIISYIKVERAKGTPDDAIRTNLLANGWNNEDITQAISSAANSASAVMTMSAAEIKVHRRKVMWMTFGVLLALDALIIVFMRVFYGMYGLFGLSVLSVLIRVLVIYLMAAFSARNASLENSAGEMVKNSIIKVIGTILVAVLIAIGVIFVTCLFLFSRSSL